jgi:predicted GNAT family acetyltransferase
MIQDYVRRTAAGGRDTERIGPFLATFSRDSTNPFLNYAIPDASARPTADEVARLAAAYETRGLTPRLEYLPRLAPDVEPVLLAVGFAVESRVPLMVCRQGEQVAQPAPAGFELFVPTSDEDLLRMLTAQHEAFGETGPPTVANLGGLRRSVDAGQLIVYARELSTGEPVGGGACTPIADGVGEVVGVAVRTKFRGQGIAAAITAYLADAAFRAGAAEVFLTPGGETAERIYRRAGFQTTDEMLFMSRMVASS